MSVPYRCVQCGETYELDDDLAGRAIRCRECHELNRVPPLPTPKQTSPPITAPIQKPKAASSLSFTKGLLAGAILMGLTGAVGLWLGLAQRKREEPRQAPAVESEHKPPSHPADEFMSRGFQATQIGDFDLAISCYGEAIRLDPTRANAYVGRGGSFYEKGRYDQAITDLSEAIKFDPKSSRAYYFRALTYAQKEDHVRAGVDCFQAKKLGITGVDPDKHVAVIYAQRGQKYLEQGRIPEASTSFRYAVKHNPNEWVYHGTLMTVAAKLEQWDEAIEEGNIAINLGADKQTILLAMGAAYLARAKVKLERGDRQGAKADYESAVKAAPELSKFASLFAD